MVCAYCIITVSHYHDYLKSKLESKSRLPFPECSGIHSIYLIESVNVMSVLVRSSKRGVWTSQIVVRRRPFHRRTQPHL